MALAEEALKDKVIYRGFIDNTLDSDVDPLKTENFGETAVMLAPLGSTEGWNQKLNQAVEEIVDDEALKNIIANYEGDELLLDMPREEEEPVRAIVREAMVNALDFGVPLEVEIGVGRTWLEAH